MIKIGANTDRTFLLNDLPKQRGVYDFLPPSGDPSNPNLQLIYVNSRTVSEKLTEGVLSTWQKQNGDPFTDLNDFFNYIEDFFFRSSVGGGGGSFNYVGEFNNYNDLIASEPAGTAGRFSYVLNSQGTQWLPASMGGTYYGAGWYYDTGSIWSNKNDEIFKGLQDLVDDKLSFVTTNSSLTGDGTPTTPLGLTEPFNDGAIYYRNGLTTDWVKHYGFSESFDLFTKEQNQNANSGEFNGCFKILTDGEYNKFTTIFNNLNLGGTQSFELRCALYDLNGDLLTQGSVTLNDSNQDDRQDILLNPVLQIAAPKGVYMVCGLNDNIGGGSAQIFRLNANATNDADFAFSFNLSNGILPSTLPPVSATNNVRYQAFYGQ